MTAELKLVPPLESTEVETVRVCRRCPEFCPVFGIKLAHSWGQGPKDETPSLDRIETSKGYERGNIAVISNRANRVKSDGTAEEHERIAAWMRSQGLE
jgi:hypothetical protein